MHFLELGADMTRIIGLMCERIADLCALRRTCKRVAGFIDVSYLKKYKDLYEREVYYEGVKFYQFENVIRYEDIAFMRVHERSGNVYQQNDIYKADIGKYKNSTQNINIFCFVDDAKGRRFLFVKNTLIGIIHRNTDYSIIYNKNDKYKEIEIKVWHKDGLIHRKNGPAELYSDGSFKWYEDGKLHRDGDFPAVGKSEFVLDWETTGQINPVNYSKKELELFAWYKKGLIHRINGPAIYYKDNYISWYQSDLRHRWDGPSNIDFNSKRTEWRLNGKLHRRNGPAIEESDGTEYWYINGKPHRLDGPAIIKPDGTRHWYLYGFLHRYDGPAIERADGTREWYHNGELHRFDGPAIEEPGGTRKWCRYGKLHRFDGPAIEYSTGKKEWFQNGYLHRCDGPAIIFENGTRKWYKFGKVHRDNGPAVIYANGIQQWYKNNVLIKFERKSRKK